MSSSNSGISRARTRQALRANTKPAPAEPTDLAPASGDSDVQFSFVGMNFTPSTGIVFVPDQAAVDETATVTGVAVTPSGQDEPIGTIQVDVSFVNLPALTNNLFRMFLTGPNGQRSFLGTVSSGA